MKPGCSTYKPWVYQARRWWWKSPRVCCWTRTPGHGQAAAIARCRHPGGAGRFRHLGYSSLSYLKKFDIDYLKIDRSFTRNLAPDSSDMALSGAIIVMAHKLDLSVIAEGVETPQTARTAGGGRLRHAQGYLFAQSPAGRGVRQAVARPARNRWRLIRPCTFGKRIVLEGG